jgi:hypothetical protein
VVLPALQDRRRKLVRDYVTKHSVCGLHKLLLGPSDEGGLACRGLRTNGRSEKSVQNFNVNCCILVRHSDAFNYAVLYPFYFSLFWVVFGDVLPCILFGDIWPSLLASLKMQSDRRVKIWFGYLKNTLLLRPGHRLV